LSPVARCEFGETANKKRQEAWEAVGPQMEATARDRCPEDQCTEEAVFTRTVHLVASHMGSQGDGHYRPHGGTHDIRIVVLGPIKQAPFKETRTSTPYCTMVIEHTNSEQRSSAVRVSSAAVDGDTKSGQVETRPGGDRAGRGGDRGSGCCDVDCGDVKGNMRSEGGDEKDPAIIASAEAPATIGGPDANIESIAAVA